MVGDGVLRDEINKREKQLEDEKCNDTVDGRNPAPPGMIWDVKDPLNDGINYQPQLYSWLEF